MGKHITLKEACNIARQNAEDAEARTRAERASENADTQTEADAALGRAVRAIYERGGYLRLRNEGSVVAVKSVPLGHDAYGPTLDEAVKAAGEGG